MAVIERGTLKILSKNELKELERDVVKQEKLAGRSDIASAKIAQRIGPALPGAVTRKQRKLLNIGLLGGRGDESGLLQKQKVQKIKSAEELTITNSILAKLGIKGKEKSLISGAGAPIQKLNLVEKMNKRLIVQEKATKGLTKAFSKLNLLGAAGASPGRVIFGTGLAAVTNVFLPAAIIAMIAQKAVELWIDSYGKGGVRDPRKPIKDDIKSLVDLELEQEIIAGKLFFANSRTLKPTQETLSNTMNLREGHNRSRIARVPYGR